MSAEPTPAFALLATRRLLATEQARRWFELWSEYEATKNEVLGVIENAAALGEEHAQVLLAMAKQRRSQLEQALVELSHAVMIDGATDAPIR